MREMKAREKGKDPVGDMKKKKAEAAAAAKKGKKWDMLGRVMELISLVENWKESLECIKEDE
jgi:hypothetical protein